MISLLAVSDSHAHFTEAVQEYTKRLGKNANLVLIKPERSTDHARIVFRETERIILALEKLKGARILLDDAGKTYTSEGFEAALNEWEMRESGAIFIVGGAYGVDRNMLGPFLNSTLSLSKMTLPHSLALLMLLEQIYRASQIKKGSSYHHG